MGHETDGEQELSVRLPIYTASANTETTSRYRTIFLVRKRWDPGSPQRAWCEACPPDHVRNRRPERGIAYTLAASFGTDCGWWLTDDCEDQNGSVGGAPVPDRAIRDWRDGRQSAPRTRPGSAACPTPWFRQSAGCPTPNRHPRSSRRSRSGFGHGRESCTC